MHPSPTKSFGMICTSPHRQTHSLRMPSAGSHLPANLGSAGNEKGRLSVPVTPAATPLSLDNSNFNRPCPPFASPPPPSPDPYPSMFFRSGGSTSTGSSPALTSGFGAMSPLGSMEFLSSQNRQMFPSRSASSNMSSGLSLYSQDSGFLMPSRSSSALSSSGQQPSNTLRQRIMKTKLCVHHLHGRCARGVNCAFAHSVNELRRPPNLYKTRLCINYSNNGCCPKGDLCRFAHGELELRAGEQQADEYARMASLRSAGATPRIGSPNLFNSTTPASVLSPTTPLPGGGENISISRPVNNEDRLLEADAIDVLLKLPEETRQQLVGLVMRTVGATQGFDKNRGPTNSWRRQTPTPTPMAESTRRASTCSTASSSRPRSGSDSTGNAATTAYGNDLFLSPCPTEDFYSSQNAESAPNGPDSLFGSYDHSTDQTIDPLSAAMLLYGRMPYLPPLPPAAIGHCDEDARLSWGAEIDRLPQLNVVPSPKTVGDRRCEVFACDAVAAADGIHDDSDNNSRDDIQRSRSPSTSPIAQEYEAPSVVEQSTFDNFMTQQKQLSQAYASLFSAGPSTLQQQMKSDAVRDEDSVEELIKALNNI